MERNQRIRHLWLFPLFADFLAIVASYYTTMLVRFQVSWGQSLFTSINRLLGVRETGQLPDMYESFYLISAPRIILLLSLTLMVLYALCDLYPGRRFIRRRPVGWNVALANMIALVLFYTYFYLGRNVFHPRSMFATILFLNVFYCVGLRGLAEHGLDSLRALRGMDRWDAVLIGSSEETGFISVFIAERHPHGIHIVRQIGLNPDDPMEELLRRAEEAVREYGAGMLILADKRLSVAQIAQLLEVGDRLDISVRVLSDKMNVLVTNAGLPLDTIAGIPLVLFEAPSVGRRYAVVQQVFSRAVAVVLSLLLLPLVALIALLIKITTRGPVFFVQERIGVNRRPFRMYKLRTMYERADEIQAQVEELNESGAGLFKIKKDPRVTVAGRFLRRYSLDELPQLWNVIRGEMVLVGPRPLPRRDFECYYENWHYGRHAGLPGMTCLWQVSGRSDLDFHNMCILDIYYLRNRNWILDLKIILRTFWVVLFAKGAY